jgi:hypothetical protein
MDIRYAQSARKHRIGRAHTHHVMENNPYVVITSDEVDRTQYVWVALDDRGLELEIIGVVLEDYVLITHVMPTSLRRRRKEWLPK